MRDLDHRAVPCVCVCQREREQEEEGNPPGDKKPVSTVENRF